MFSPDKWLANASTGFYSHTIDQSLRFEDGDSPNLSKTYSTAQTNTKKITVSVWVKRANISNSRSTIILGRSGGAGRIAFENNNTLVANAFDTGYNGFTSSALFRDVSAWYHIVYQGNSDTSTLADINKVYVNGVQQTNANSSSLTPQNSATNIIRNGIPTYIGKDPDSSAYYFDGYLAEMHTIDGSIVAPTEFAETKDGVWIPKEYSGSYGTNGFYMTFQGTGTATTDDGTTAQLNIGDDQSGNGRNFAVSGLASSDVMTGESPTNNFACLNPLSKGSGTITFSEGNLKSSTSANLNPSEHGATFTIPKSGKWYWEAAYTGAYTNGGVATMMGIMDIDTQTVGQSGNHINNTTGDYITYYSHNSGVYENNTLDSSFSGNETAATVGFALDMDNGYLFIHLNGTYIGGTPNFSTGANHAAEPNKTRTWLPFFGASGGGAITWRANFGQDSEGISSAQSPDNGIGTFEYDVPADYKALCSANLPEPEIIDGTDHFNTVLWTGNGSDGRSITGVGFDPDFVWIKSRNLTTSHLLNDTVRGANKSLFSEGTTAETPDNGGGYLSAFVTDGFSVTSGGSGDDAVNDGSDTYVAWNWLAGTAFSNSSGSNGANVDSSGQVNTKAGFSIVSWQYTTSADNLIAHGLSSAPEMMIVKSRTTAYNWDVYHTALSAPTKRFILNGTTTSTGTGGEVAGFFDTAPTNTLFEYDTSAATNNDNMIAYCFHSVEGYSKIGTYSGNNSADGTFVYTGFRPALVMIKLYNAAGLGWGVYDSARDSDNVVTQILYWNDADDESIYSTVLLDFLSNGFKLRGNYSSINAGYNYLYLAFAEQPFKFANAR